MLLAFAMQQCALSRSTTRQCNDGCRLHDVAPARPLRDGTLSACPSLPMCRAEARSSARTTAARAAPRERRGSVWDSREKQQFFSPSSWKAVGASPEIIEAVQGLGITKPSHIQGEAYDALRSGAKHVVIADHAGSGKTLAYLLPNIQNIREEEERGGSGSMTIARNPRVVVVCPTEELCSQVMMNCRALSKVAKFRAGSFTGGFKLATQRDMLKEGVDIAICTPGRLRQLIDVGHLQLNECRALVLDEVDVLLGEHGAFTEQVAPLIEMANTETRFILVTATLPETVFVQLKYVFPGLVTALGPNLHRTAVGVTEQLVDCSGGSDMSFEGAVKRKLDAMWTVMQQQQVPRTIVFCNKIETCRDVENFIARQDKTRRVIAAVPYHAAVEPVTRSNNLRAFLQTPKPEEAAQVLICTDRASRGIDSLHTEHVVLFDFPRDPSEYVRRVGRTARGASGKGVVSVLVMGRQVKLAQEIINRNQKGLPIHTVPTGSSVRDVVDSRY